MGDLVLIFNDSGKAPSVVRNIRGDIVFENKTAKICVLHSTQQKIEQADVEAILTPYGVESVQFDSRPCPESDLQNYDVLFALRGEWLKQPPSYMAPLLGQIEDGKFQELKTLTKAALDDIKNKDTAESARLENEIAKGTQSGYGLIKIKNGASSVCITTSDDVQDAQIAMLTDNNKMLSRIFGSTPETLSRTVEAAFRDAKRGECGAIFGERGDLWDAIQGLRRDNVSYSVVPLWFDTKQVAERAESMRNEKKSEAEKNQNDKRQQEENAELETRRKEAERETQQSREEELRKEHGPKAHAYADEIFDGVKTLIQGSDSWTASAFPQLSGWYRESTADGWEYVSANSAISDFGTVNWKGRPLEVAITDVSIEMKNCLLGEKKTTCFRLGLIFDAEFKMHREPFVTSCDQSSGEDWKQARGFQSEWVAQ